MLLSLVVGIDLWVADVAVDAVWFYDRQSFWDLPVALLPGYPLGEDRAQGRPATAASRTSSSRSTAARSRRCCLKHSRGLTRAAAKNRIRLWTWRIRAPRHSAAFRDPEPMRNHARVNRPLWGLATTVLLCVCALARADDEGVAPQWAKVADEQVKYARKARASLGARLPVARTVDPGGAALKEAARALRLVLIPPGTFTMGSTVKGKDCDCPTSPLKDERPAHVVRITKPFYIGIYEVTQEQYESVMGKNPSRYEGKGAPVEHVSWLDARRFCRKLSDKTGMTFRLPTEAEWEYACRAGSSTTYFHGDDPDHKDLAKYAWYADSAGDLPRRVGQLRPNRWGLYDVLGNVKEWCSDRYDAEYYAQSPVDDPKGPGNPDFIDENETHIYHVIRGSNWEYGPYHVRCARRDRAPAKFACAGLRVVMEAPEPAK